MYFNQKYDRVGSLFQGRFKSVGIESDEYLMHLSRYIHINPVELIEKGWREKGIKDWQKVRKFLESYRYSSYPDYIGIKNFPSVISIDFLLGYLKGSNRYRDFVEGFASDYAILGHDLLFE